MLNPARPEPMWRSIPPHPFDNDRLRWHVRAFCHIIRKFEDFLLSRCLEAYGDEEARAAAKYSCCNETFLVALSPNPALSKSQQDTVVQDYNMSSGSVSVPLRKALLYYFQKRLWLDAVSAFDGPHEMPVVIKNREGFARALAEATA